MRQVLIAGISGAIGRALAERLLEQDSELSIVGLCRNPSSVAFNEEQAGRVTLIEWDAANKDSAGCVAEKLQEVMPGGEGLDMVIYAAGILHGPGMMPEKRLEDCRSFCPCFFGKRHWFCNAGSGGLTLASPSAFQAHRGGFRKGGIDH